MLPLDPTPPTHSPIPTQTSRKLDDVRRLVEEEGMLPNRCRQKDLVKYQALHLAAMAGRVDVVKYLVLECGVASKTRTTTAIPPAGRVDVDAPLYDGATALLLALQEKQEEVALCLIRECNANIEAKDRGLTALMWACHRNLVEVVRCLVLEKAADIQTKDKDGQALAYVAAREGSMEVLAFLVEEMKVDVESMDHNNQKLRLLYVAACSGHLGTVKWLVESGHANVRARSGNNEWVASHAAAAFGHLEVLRYLIEEGKAPVDDAAASCGSTPLRYAAGNGRLEIVEWLVESAGADVYAAGRDGLVPKEAAHLHGQEEVLAYLEERELAALEDQDQGRVNRNQRRREKERKAKLRRQKEQQEEEEEAKNEEAAEEEEEEEEEAWRADKARELKGPLGEVASIVDEEESEPLIACEDTAPTSHSARVQPTHGGGRGGATLAACRSHRAHQGGGAGQCGCQRGPGAARAPRQGCCGRGRVAVGRLSGRVH